MIDPHELHLITHSKTLILRQMGWSEGEPLTEEQAIELSQLMTEKMGKPISSGALRQFWNQPEEDASRHTDMLDALAHFQGYQNWKGFQDTHQLKLGNSGTALGASPVANNAGLETLALVQKKNRNLMTWVWVLAGLNLLLLGFLLYRIFGT